MTSSLTLDYTVLCCRCGECTGCQRKDNCGDCAPCRNEKSHQICKMRRCDRLTEKKVGDRIIPFSDDLSGGPVWTVEY